MWPEGQRIHLAGVGGSGMRSLARYLVLGGATLTGSDLNGPAGLDELLDLGLTLIEGDRQGVALPEVVDLVVHTAAVSSNHPLLKDARDRGVEVLKYSRMLGRIMEHFNGVAVAGTHGKTSVSALSAWLLRHGGRQPSYVVGGEAPDLSGGGGWGAGDLFIAEACEFDRSFLNLKPLWAIVTNLEPDHLDYYGTFENLIDAFAELLRGVAARRGFLVLCEDAAKYLNPLHFTGLTTWTYGFSEGSDLRILDMVQVGENVHFRIDHEGRSLGRFTLRQPGRHNVLNAAAALLLGLKMGVSPDTLREGLKRFRGVKRRLEDRGLFGGIRLLSDYAHHPTEVRAVHQALRSRYPNARIVVAYQGHQNWRMGYFLDDFAGYFARFDEALILDTFSVREGPGQDHPDGRSLVEAIRTAGGRSHFAGGLVEAPREIAKCVKEGDILVIMGAGDIDGIFGDLEAVLSASGERASRGDDHRGHRGHGAAIA